jgi:predicted metalloprotease with PDZ domain
MTFLSERVSERGSKYYRRHRIDASEALPDLPLAQVPCVKSPDGIDDHAIMKRFYSMLSGLLLTAASASGQVQYDVSFPNAVHHEAEVAVTFRHVPPAPLELRMSRSSPGRYALHEFGKNIYRVRATDGSGRPLALERPDPYQWNVAQHDSVVTVRYTLFADRADGTYSQVDLTHAHLNMPATFLWARGMQDAPIRVTFHVPDGTRWKVATQLFPSDDPYTYTAPNMDYFMDSPTELSNFMMAQWPVAGPDREYTVRFALHHTGTRAEFDEYVAWAMRVVAEEVGVFGEPAPYDVGRYTFIGDYLPWASGDGMEHRNSTILASSSSLASNALGLLGTVSHEFFHSWNVERIRPRGLQPFDFERANMSRALWFAEGFTSYYTPLFIRRAGITTNEQFANALSGNLTTVMTAPGREFFTPVEMSMQAPFVDAATAIDPDNKVNTFISYYTWGAMIGLNLDLTLRTERNRTLDDFMRLVWQKFGKTEISYTVPDLQAALTEFTGDAEFAQMFFGRFIQGHDVPDYTALLARFGFLVRKANPGRPTLGQAQFQFGSDGATVTEGTVIGTPLYQAGIDRGARITALDRRRITNAEDFRTALAGKHPGESIEITFEQRGTTLTARTSLIEDPRLEVVPFEEAGMTLEPAVRRMRDEWLASRAQLRE